MSLLKHLRFLKCLSRKAWFGQSRCVSKVSLVDNGVRVNTSNGFDLLNQVHRLVVNLVKGNVANQTSKASGSSRSLDEFTVMPHKSC